MGLFVIICDPTQGQLCLTAWPTPIYTSDKGTYFSLTMTEVSSKGELIHHCILSNIIMGRKEIVDTLKDHLIYLKLTQCNRVETFLLNFNKLYHRFFILLPSLIS